MSLVAGTVRGAWRRAGVSLGILLVATVAAAAAAAGPAYDAAARASILQDNLHNQPPIARTVEVDSAGPVVGLASNLSSQVTSILAGQLGGPATVARLFQPPVEAILAQVSTGGHSTPLTWRTDACAHLQLTAGSCPREAGQVMVSTSYARLSRVRPGDTIATASGYGHLTVTGVVCGPVRSAIRGRLLAEQRVRRLHLREPEVPHEPPALGCDVHSRGHLRQRTAQRAGQRHGPRRARVGPRAARRPADPQGGGERTAHRPHPPRTQREPNQLHPADGRPDPGRLADAGRTGLPDHLSAAAAHLAPALPHRHGGGRGARRGGRAGETARSRPPQHRHVRPVRAGAADCPGTSSWCARGLGGRRGPGPDPAAARHARRTAGARDRRRRGRHARRPGRDRARRPARPGPPGHRAMAAHGPPRCEPGLGARRGAAHRGPGRAGRADHSPGT